MQISCSRQIRRHLRWPLLYLSWALVISPLPNAAAEQPAAGTTLKALQQQGWTVTKKTTRSEELPGVAPYQDLTRVLSITTYSLLRGDQTATCELVYDSQRDHFEERCTAEAQ